MSDKPVPQGFATLYACMIPKLIPIAREHGYCFALHGSLANDLDAVCVPWVENASDEVDLIKSLGDCIGGFVVCGDKEEVDRLDAIGKPSLKPHGRRTYTISFGGAMYMDITVMPKGFQDRVSPFMAACFGPEISSDVTERNHRFLEESLELVQSKGCTASEAHQLVDYVFSRPVGEPSQEAGGVMVTLAALCLAAGLSMEKCGDVELARVWTKIDVIRAKQAAKPKHSPLPQ